MQITHTLAEVINFIKPFGLTVGHKATSTVQDDKEYNFLELRVQAFGFTSISLARPQKERNETWLPQ